MRRAIALLATVALAGLLAIAATAPGPVSGSGAANIAANPTVCIEASSTPGGQLGTRRNPAPIGNTLTAQVRDSDIDVTVTEVVTGQEALDRLKDANQFNEAPPEGSEYVLFFARAHITKTPGEEAVSLTYFDLRMVDSTGKIQAPASVVTPEPEFSGQGFEGVTIEGWNAFTRKTGEPVSLVFGMETFQGTGGAWWGVPGAPGQ